MLREARRKLKFKALARRIGGEVIAVGTLEMLWHATAENAPDGGIGRFSDADLEAELCWQGEPDELVRALIETGWLDRIDGEARLYVHGWHEHADHTVQRKIARSHGFFANGSAPKFTTLDKPEREKAAEFYAGNPQVTREQPAESVRGQGQEQARSKPGALSVAAAAAPAADAASDCPAAPDAPARPGKNPRPQPPAWAMQLSKLLHDLAADAPGGRIASPSALAESARQIDRLSREATELIGADPAPRIEAAIRWAFEPEQIESKFTPIVRCGKSLREKWTRLTLAAQRAQDEQRNPMQDMLDWMNGAGVRKGVMQ